MIKVIAVIFFLVALAFAIQGFTEVATAPDLFDSHEEESAAVAEEVADEE